MGDELLIGQEGLEEALRRAQADAESPVNDEPVNLEETAEDAARRFARRLLSIERAHSPRIRTVEGYVLRWCRECQQDYPCPTVRVAQGADDDA